MVAAVVVATVVPRSGADIAAPSVSAAVDVEIPATPSTAGEPSPSIAARPAPGEDAATSLAQLDGIPIVSGYSDERYDRDRFGQRWMDVDRNGCDTRNDILGRDLLDPVFKERTNECKVLAGLLIDPYDGQSVEFVSGRDTSVLVQIDHVVALAWAWRHGAEHWSDDQRTAFANDPRNLVAASEHTNQEKSDSGPAEWLPPVPELRCRYVEQYVSVLAAYRLGISAADEAAARGVLESC